MNNITFGIFQLNALTFSGVILDISPSFEKHMWCLKKNITDNR